MLVLHKIYPSARETADSSMAAMAINGRTLFERSRETLGGASSRFHYIDEPDDGFEPLSRLLAPGDLFITMGAGDNWRLGKKLFAHFSAQAAPECATGGTG